MELNGQTLSDTKNGNSVTFLFATTALIGFAIIGASTFLDFTPVVAQNWRASGVGLPVMISCLIGAYAMARRDFFTGFFIAIFAGFFLTHEIIIIYDNKAVEMGMELGPNGWFRPVLNIYRDAFSFNTGAFWALIGVLIALFSVVTGGLVDTVSKNHMAQEQAEAVTKEAVEVPNADEDDSESFENPADSKNGDDIDADQIS